MSSQQIKVFNHDKEKIKIVVEDNVTAIEADLQELHFKVDGTIDDMPSLAFVSMINHYAIVSQVSLTMLNDAFTSLGYTITKTQ